jgi:hypothetical protein
MVMTLDPAEPKFAVQQRRSYAALLLVTGPPVIDLTPGSYFANPNYIWDTVGVEYCKG